VPTLEAENIKGAWGDDKIAGCELTWAYLINAGKVPEFVKLLSVWDCWQDQDKTYWNDKVKPFQMAMRMTDYEPSTDLGYCIWKLWFDKAKENATSFIQEEIRARIETGRIVIKYQTEMNIDLMKRSFDMTFEGLRVIVVNGYKGSPQFDSRYGKPQLDYLTIYDKDRP
jgi:hypothetical protein